MAKFVKGDVVVIPFPFSDLSQSKRRPALVIAPLDGNDVILCQITSKITKDTYAISIEDTDFTSGGLETVRQYKAKSAIYCGQQHHSIPGR